MSTVQSFVGTEPSAQDVNANALNDNTVDVEIEPDVKSNDVKLSLCSLSFVFNCFSGNNRPK